MIAPDTRDRELERGKIDKEIARVLAQLAKFVVGKRAIIVVRVLPAIENVHHFVCAHRHHRPQHHAIDQRENGRVNPDGQRQRQYRDGREPRRLDQLPDRKLEILNHRILLRISSVMRGTV